MSHEQFVLAAVRIGCRTLPEIAKQLGLQQARVSPVLFRMMLTGKLYRTKDAGNGRPIFRYILPDSPEGLAERRARVERMREWAPAALEEMRRVR